MDAQQRARILGVVRGLPAGRVATYGQVAELAGLPRRARLVGRVMAGLPDHTDVPWHRVVAAGGRSAFPAGSAGQRRQLARLKAEGVVVKGARIHLDSGGAAPRLDELIWGPLLAGDVASQGASRRKRRQARPA